MAVLVMRGMESLPHSDSHTRMAVYFFSENVRQFAKDPHQANSKSLIMQDFWLQPPPTLIVGVGPSMKITDSFLSQSQGPGF